MSGAQKASAPRTAVVTPRIVANTVRLTSCRSAAAAHNRTSHRRLHTRLGLWSRRLNSEPQADGSLHRRESRTAENTKRTNQLRVRNRDPVLCVEDAWA